MAINIYLPKILKEEMFDLLTRRYNASYDEIRQEDRHQKILIYRDSINLIQNYDEWLLRIKQDVRSAEIVYEKMNLIEKEKFLEGISTLQYTSELLPNWQGLEIPTCRKFMKYMLESEFGSSRDNPKNSVMLFNGTFKLNKFCTDNSKDFYCFPKEDLARTYIQISEIIKTKVKADATVGDTFNLSDEEESYFQYFNCTLDQFGQLYVMCLDIKLYATLHDASMSYDTLFKVLKDKISTVRQLIGQIENLQSCLLRLEPMQELGINLHCVLMFNCKGSNFSEDGIIAQLDKKLKSIPGFSSANYDIGNWGKILRKYHDTKVGGLIKKNNEESRYSCWYWIYSYFFTVNQVIGLNLEEGKSTYEIKPLSSHSLLPPNTLQKTLGPVEKEPISFAEMQVSTKTKKILDPKHLTEATQEYLEKVKLMDLPLAVFPISHNDRMTYDSLLYSIEFLVVFQKVC